MVCKWDVKTWLRRDVAISLVTKLRKKSENETVSSIPQISRVPVRFAEFRELQRDTRYIRENPLLLAFLPLHTLL